MNIKEKYDEFLEFRKEIVKQSKRVQKVRHEAYPEAYQLPDFDFHENNIDIRNGQIFNINTMDRDNEEVTFFFCLDDFLKTDQELIDECEKEKIDDEKLKEVNRLYKIRMTNERNLEIFNKLKKELIKNNIL